MAYTLYLVSVKSLRLFFFSPLYTWVTFWKSQRGVDWPLTRICGWGRRWHHTQHWMPPVSHGWPKHTTESPHLSWEPSDLFILSGGTRQGIIINSYHSFYKLVILTSPHSYHNPMRQLSLYHLCEEDIEAPKCDLPNSIVGKGKNGTNLAILLTFIHLNHLFIFSFNWQSY